MSSPRPNRKPLLVAFSVVLGVAIAASGQYFVDRPQGEAPEDSGASMLIAAPSPNGGFAGPAQSSTSAGTKAETGSGAPSTSTTTSETTTDKKSAETSSNSPDSTTSSKDTKAPTADDETTTDPPATRNETTTDKPPRHTQPPAARGDSKAARVVELVNYVRQRAGCDSLRTDGRLTAAAQGHSDDMSARGYFSHTSPEGTSFADRARAAGHPSPGAENIARGLSEPEDVMRMWMESPGHRQNILNCELETIGVGVTTRGWYWTQVFGY
ncbi:CAP domain-containing protein [Amycolatopsis marina]|uniref:CAP domain-containing protein n=1 Tax=Amycolatopsis marina TaxID=490629 RepID=UPI0011605D00|nr:CAP domain-containing protein [Amycolatopsis marina]